VSFTAIDTSDHAAMDATFFDRETVKSNAFW